MFFDNCTNPFGCYMCVKEYRKKNKIHVDKIIVDKETVGGYLCSTHGAKALRKATNNNDCLAKPKKQKKVSIAAIKKFIESSENREELLKLLGATDDVQDNS